MLCVRVYEMCVMCAHVYACMCVCTACMHIKLYIATYCAPMEKRKEKKNTLWAKEIYVALSVSLHLSLFSVKRMFIQFSFGACNFLTVRIRKRLTISINIDFYIFRCCAFSLSVCFFVTDWIARLLAHFLSWISSLEPVTWHIYFHIKFTKRVPLNSFLLELFENWMWVILFFLLLLLFFSIIFPFVHSFDCFLFHFAIFIGPWWCHCYHCCHQRIYLFSSIAWSFNSFCSMSSSAA